MAGGRWIAVAVAMLAAGMLAAVLAVPSGAATPRPALCLIDCSTTTASPVSTTSTPVPGAVTVSDLTPTTARLSAPLNTGGQAVSYGWYFQGGTEVTRAYSAPAQPDPTTVTYADTGLTPNAAYEVQLSVGDSLGPITRFKTPLLPALPITFSTHANVIKDSQDLYFRTAIPRAAKVDDGDIIDLQQRLPDGRWANAPGYTSPTETTVLPASHQLILSVAPDRNTRIRAVLVGTNFDDKLDDGDTAPIRHRSLSASIPVYVLPDITSSVDRPDDGPDLQVTYSALVHPLPAHFRGEPVYFYAGAPHATSLSLLGSRRLRRSISSFDGATSVVATFTFSDTAAAEIVVCVRHAILSDMGVPFTDRSCGAPTIAP